MRVWQKALIALSLFGIVAAILIYTLLYNKPHVNYEKAKPSIILSAEKLHTDFIINNTLAENLYSGNVIQISGVLSMIEETDRFKILVFSFGEGIFGPEGVRCILLENYADLVDNEMVGTFITLKGLCTGFTGSDVIIEHCSLIM
jgi:hypothetical protein